MLEILVIRNTAALVAHLVGADPKRYELSFLSHRHHVRTLLMIMQQMGEERGGGAITDRGFFVRVETARHHRVPAKRRGLDTDRPVLLLFLASPARDPLRQDEHPRRALSPDVAARYPHLLTSLEGRPPMIYRFVLAEGEVVVIPSTVEQMSKEPAEECISDLVQASALAIQIIGQCSPSLDPPFLIGLSSGLARVMHSFGHPEVDVIDRVQRALQAEVSATAFLLAEMS